jgi:hypothetical protein
VTSPTTTPLPTWLVPRLAELRAMSRGGRLVLPFGSRHAGAVYRLATLGVLRVETDKAKRIQIISFTREPS